LAHPELAAGGRLRFRATATAVVVGIVLFADAVVVARTSRYGFLRQIAAQPVASAPQPGPPCPLSGLPSPTGVVPHRPALAIKVDNYPAARPQTGLDHADLVFEEPIEGGVTRFVAVFQCAAADLVGSLRSARAVDESIIDELGAPVFLHVGGIEPVLTLIHRADPCDEDLVAGGNDVQSPPGRYAPYDTYVSTASGWSLCHGDTTPPPALFAYSATPPTGVPVKSIHIPFSHSSDSTWTWDAANRHWLLSYNGVPARLANGSQISAVNVVVQQVRVSYGPWIENSRGDREVQSQLTGSGPLLVFRDGVEASGTWQRASLREPTRLTGKDGSVIALQPGQTWIAIVPAEVVVTAAAVPGP